MSDGGAQRFHFGRVLLWFAASWLTLSALTTQRRSGLLFLALFFLGLLFSLAALLGGFFAERKKRSERAGLRNLLLLLLTVAATLLGGLWLAFRKKREVAVLPPTEHEIDELVR